MTQPFRTASGGRIRRDQPLAFRFDGRDYLGCAGDTLASALLANDVHLVGRSFKYHRPRGIVAAGAEEPNALVTIERGADRVTPNLRATQVALYDGLQARSQNCWPSLRFDVGAAADRIAPLLSAGFYYKTFMWPRGFWRRLYEPAIRAAAGLGRAPRTADPDRYLQQYAHCDVLVIGAGPAGIAAALAASANNARVILCDAQHELGGSLLAETDAIIDGHPAAAWLDAALTELAARDHVALLPRTTAFGVFAENLFGLVTQVTDHLADPDPRLPRERLWQVRATAVVLATGAIEQPLVLPHNDRPGVMLADAARVYLQRYGVTVGARIAIATAHDNVYRAALALHAAGIGIAAIADLRAAPTGTAVVMAREAGLPVITGARVTGTRGRLRIREMQLADCASIPCDALLTCGGWAPALHLFSQARGRLRFDPSLGAFLPDTTTAPIRCAGGCAGEFDLAACLDAGYAAGEAAARSHPPPRRFAVSGTLPCDAANAWFAPPPHRKAFVDLQNDVTTFDLHTATSEGFHAIEHVKRYTTAGMATDQGKTSGINTLAMIGGLLGQPAAAVGHTTFRMPYTPVTFGALAGTARGPLLDPERRTPLHDVALAVGAVFEDVGAWKRARYFPRAGETLHPAVARECRAVRNDVGMLDASTLGKIDVRGADAAAFLDRLYGIDVATIAPGRCRYALLLGEDGFVRDDGVIARLAPDHFHVTTTTSGAASVLHHMEDYRQTEFPELRVWLTSVTEQFAVVALQGPRAPALLAPLLDDAGVAAMPHLAVRECRVCGVPAQLFRVSFTGEIGYEINVPAAFAPSIWQALLAAGATPYGTEAMHVLRAEKGYIIIDQETDGTVTPDDLGLGWMFSRTKRDFVGRRSLVRPDMRRGDRLQLVGLQSDTVLEEGAQLVAEPSSRVSLGHVTSAYWSEALQRPIALALLSAGRARQGSRIHVPMPDRVIAAQVVSPVFYDAAGERLRGMVAPPAAEQIAAPAVASVLSERRAIGSDCVRIKHADPVTRFIVRADTAAAAAIGAKLGVLLGTSPCRAVTVRDRVALWLGPDEWMVLTEQESVPPGTVDASVVDVSHGFVGIDVSGPRAVWCINAFNALDLDPRIFPPGACTRTVFGKAPIILWHVAADAFRIEVARSFAPYVWQCLAEAAREFLPMEVGQ